MKNLENSEISGIRDFSYFQDFYPRDFRKIPEIRDFLPLGYLGDFLSPGSGFFSRDEISRQIANSVYRGLLASLGFVGQRLVKRCF